MNRDKVKEILDKSNVEVTSEIEIIEYIDYLENRISKAIEYIGLNEEDLKLYDIYDVNGIKILDILRGEDNDNFGTIK